MIAATHRDLAAMIREEKFREDMFYRLNVFPIEIPPLRERREDIPLLVNYFVSKLSRRMGKRSNLSRERGMEMLTSSPWKGNVRELANFIERAVILTRGKEFEVPIARASPHPPDACYCPNSKSTFRQAETGDHRGFKSRVGTDSRQSGSRRTART